MSKSSPPGPKHHTHILATLSLSPHPLVAICGGLGLARQITNSGQRPTVGENREFWLLKTSLIFQVISWDLDVDLLRHMALKIQ